MRPAIGISVASDHLFMILVRDNRVVWQAEEACVLPVDGPETISAMLCKAPIRDRPRPRIGAALGLQASQVRRIRGLPPIDDQAVLEAIIREAMSTFFLSEQDTLLPTSVTCTEPGVVWAGALDATWLELVRRGCKVRGWRLNRAAPTAAALLHAFDDEQFEWLDGGLLLTVARANGELADIRRSVDGAEGRPSVAQKPADVLDSQDETSPRGAPALGVTRMVRGEGLVLGVKERPWTGTEFRKSMRPPLLLLALASAILLLSPLAWMATEWSASNEIAAMEPERWARAAVITEQIAQVNEVLRQASAFHAERSSVLTFLDDLAEHLPDSVFVADLRVDRNQAQLIMVGPGRFDYQATFEGFPGVSHVEQVETATATPPDAEALRRTGIRIQLVPNDSMGPAASPGTP